MFSLTFLYSKCCLNRVFFCPHLFLIVFCNFVILFAYFPSMYSSSFSVKLMCVYLILLLGVMGSLSFRIEVMHPTSVKPHALFIDQQS